MKLTRLIFVWDIANAFKKYTYYDIERLFDWYNKWNELWKFPTTKEKKKWENCLTERESGTLLKDYECFSEIPPNIK